MKCLDKFLERPIFSDASIERLCNVTTVSDNVLVCVRGGCSVKDLLEYMREERVSCNRADIDNDHNIRAINFFILGAILVSISIRLSTKFHRFTKWGVDDYLIIPAAILAAIQTIIMILMTWSGLGHDIWTISEETTTRFFIYLLVVEFTYVLSLCLIKLSILFFFLRIFPTQHLSQSSDGPSHLLFSPQPSSWFLQPFKAPLQSRHKRAGMGSPIQGRVSTSKL
ncbi:hypothetical protein SNK04_004133 [Fusarium graminearum]